MESSTVLLANSFAGQGTNLQFNTAIDSTVDDKSRWSRVAYVALDEEMFSYEF
jgi:hypothetical protein